MDGHSTEAPNRSAHWQGAYKDLSAAACVYISKTPATRRRTFTSPNASTAGEASRTPAVAALLPASARLLRIL
jgi:hypothetical protein